MTKKLQIHTKGLLVTGETIPRFKWFLKSSSPHGGALRLPSGAQVRRTWHLALGWSSWPAQSFREFSQFCFPDLNWERLHFFVFLHFWSHVFLGGDGCTDICKAPNVRRKVFTLTLDLLVNALIKKHEAGQCFQTRFFLPSCPYAFPWMTALLAFSRLLCRVAHIGRSASSDHHGQSPGRSFFRDGCAIRSQFQISATQKLSPFAWRQRCRVQMRRAWAKVGWRFGSTGGMFDDRSAPDTTRNDGGRY